jgi:hypothetical protein
VCPDSHAGADQDGDEQYGGEAAPSDPQNPRGLPTTGAGLHQESVGGGPVWGSSVSDGEGSGGGVTAGGPAGADVTAGDPADPALSVEDTPGDDPTAGDPVGADAAAGETSDGPAAATTSAGGSEGEDSGVSGTCLAVHAYQSSSAISSPSGKKIVSREPARKLSANGIGGMLGPVLLRS